jgi:hypothetical protein
MALVPERFHPSLPAVTFAVRVLAVWLAAFWLPLTMHCELAELRFCCDLSICCENDSSCGDDSCCGDAPECHPAICKILKTENYRPGDAPVSAPAVAVDWIASHPSMTCRELPAPMVILNEATGAPPGSFRAWQFVFRAAPAPRAPSALC